jgi:hypothetical protein
VAAVDGEVSYRPALRTHAVSGAFWSTRRMRAVRSAKQRWRDAGAPCPRLRREAAHSRSVVSVAGSGGVTDCRPHRESSPARQLRLRWQRWTERVERDIAAFQHCGAADGARGSGEAAPPLTASVRPMQPPASCFKPRQPWRFPCRVHAAS